MSLSMITVIGFKIFKLLVVLLKYLIRQLSLFMTGTLHTTLVFILVSKLILEFFFSNKVFWFKTRKRVGSPDRRGSRCLNLRKNQVNSAPC